jgi:hypothetical protein
MDRRRSTTTSRGTSRPPLYKDGWSRGELGIVFIYVDSSMLGAMRILSSTPQSQFQRTTTNNGLQLSCQTPLCLVRCHLQQTTTIYVKGGLPLRIRGCHSEYLHFLSHPSHGSNSYTFSLILRMSAAASHASTRAGLRYGKIFQFFVSSSSITSWGR